MKPDWLKIKIKRTSEFKDLNSIIKSKKLHTVCEEARCPNIYECWNRRTATIMILGDICTRRCGFCSVKTGAPLSIDYDEPARTADAVKLMGLKHVVITSVDRDDLKDDYGAEIWAETIKRVRSECPETTIEVLTPDFQANQKCLERVFTARPDIFSHNIECVPRISREVRPQSSWERSMKVLEESVKYGLNTKTGIMAGLGETDSEIKNVMSRIKALGVNIFNIGQYLQPTKDHLEVSRYVTPEQFAHFKEYGLGIGFSVVESGPLVRSSYHADEQAKAHFEHNEV